MSNAMTVTPAELAILAHLTQVETLRGLWVSSVDLSDDEVEEVCAALEKKELLVPGVTSQLRVASHVPFLLDIAAHATSRAECVQYTDGRMQSIMQLYAMGEDLLLATFDQQEGYEFLWVPTQQLAIGGMLNFLQAEDKGQEHAADGSAAPCDLADEAEASAWVGSAPDGTDALVFSFFSTQFPQQPLGLLRKDNRLYTKEAPDAEALLPLNKLDAILPVSRWLAHVHQGELRMAMEVKP